ncbi:unnamed protein product [Nesidiocoris tenuis]|uniref:Uncharacterized protein n=1 Tax=Nesidiocoris tenuis TaxID=355587 RepID=A0A6H5GFH6_9HEMI|nr:unnamed protein product [Nesidiocoris tenuis]
MEVLYIIYAPLDIFDQNTLKRSGNMIKLFHEFKFQNMEVFTCWTNVVVSAVHVSPRSKVEMRCQGDPRRSNPFQFHGWNGSSLPIQFRKLVLTMDRQIFNCVIVMKFLNLVCTNFECYVSRDVSTDPYLNVKAFEQLLFKWGEIHGRNGINRGNIPEQGLIMDTSHSPGRFVGPNVSEVVTLNMHRSYYTRLLENRHQFHSPDAARTRPRLPTGARIPDIPSEFPTCGNPRTVHVGATPTRALTESEHEKPVRRLSQLFDRRKTRFVLSEKETAFHCVSLRDPCPDLLTTKFSVALNTEKPPAPDVSSLDINGLGDEMVHLFLTILLGFCPRVKRSERDILERGPKSVMTAAVIFTMCRTIIGREFQDRDISYLKPLHQ